MLAEKTACLYLVNRLEMEKVQLCNGISVLILDTAAVDVELSNVPSGNYAIIKKNDILATVQRINQLFSAFAEIDVLLSQLQNYVLRWDWPGGNDRSHCCYAKTSGGCFRQFVLLHCCGQ